MLDRPEATRPDQLDLGFDVRRGAERRPLRFLDLFAGIGGTRMGLERSGAHCVLACEIDVHARRTYEANFGTVDATDIRELSARDLPSHDILAAGLPAASFSVAGISKLRSLGRPDGWADPKSGHLFFEIVRLVEDSPVPSPVLFLDSVKGLLAHDRGMTFRVIVNALEDRGYSLSWKVVDARHWVPQRRARLFIVGMHRDLFAARTFAFPEPPNASGPTLDSILEPIPVNSKYTLTEHFWRYLQDRAAKQRAIGNGFAYGLAGPGDVSRTLSARYHKDGSEILVRTSGPTPRRLTPRECARLMGFPDYFKVPVSDTRAYMQFGNAAVVPVVEFIGRSLVEQLRG